MLSPIALTFRSCSEFTETGFIMVAISSMVTIEINPRPDFSTENLSKEAN